MREKGGSSPCAHVGGEAGVTFSAPLAVLLSSLDHGPSGPDLSPVSSTHSSPLEPSRPPARHPALVTDGLPEELVHLVALERDTVSSPRHPEDTAGYISRIHQQDTSACTMSQGISPSH